MIMPEHPWPWVHQSPLPPVVGQGGEHALASLPAGDGTPPAMVCIVREGEALMVPHDQVPPEPEPSAEPPEFLGDIPE